MDVSDISFLLSHLEIKASVLNERSFNVDCKTLDLVFFSGSFCYWVSQVMKRLEAAFLFV